MTGAAWLSRIIVIGASCLLLSSCGYHDYAVTSQAIAEAQMRSDERMVELATSAGERGNIAGVMAAGYLIGSRSCSRQPSIQAPASGADYLREIGKIGTIGLGIAAINAGSDVLTEALRQSGGNVQVGGDSIGGDYAPVSEEIMEVDSE